MSELQEQALQQSIRACQERIQGFFQFLSDEPTTGRSGTFRAGLNEIVGNLEARVKEAVNTQSKGRPSPHDGENVYRMLGAHRGVSEAMGDFVASTDAMHWSRWKEA